MKKDARLSSLIDSKRENTSLGRNLLSEQAAETIRDYIGTGRLPGGAKITENEVGTLLGISRAPARDALKILEAEGLVVSRPKGRYVRALSEGEVRDLHELRCALETLAVRLAAERAGEAERELIAARLHELEKVAAAGDPNEWTRCDLALHRSLWQAAGNEHLFNALDSVISPVFILFYRDNLNQNRDVARVMQDHRNLVELVSTGKAEEAVAAVEEHMERTLENSLEKFRVAETLAPAASILDFFDFAGDETAARGMGSLAASRQTEKKLNRYSIISRNDIVYTQPELTAPLTVGNGQFAITVDPTGLQTFADSYDQGIPLSTMADWGWNNKPNPNNYKIEDVYREFDAHGRKVSYPYDPIIDPMSQRGEEFRRFGSEAAKWLYENPHRIGLGRIGMVLNKADGTPAALGDLQNIKQHLKLWSGHLESYFELEGQPVAVETVVHPDMDILGFSVVSPLLQTGQLKIDFRFPYAKGDWLGAPEDWHSSERHETVAVAQSKTRVELSRKLDDAIYGCAIAFAAGSTWQKRDKHRYFLAAEGADRLDCTVAFSPSTPPPKLPAFADICTAVADHWKRYWSNGAIVDLSKSKDPRWRDLDRRIVLSQYVTAVNCAGALPPQETGLVMNTWYGKFHLEMHFWHAAHFALWGRLPLMMRSMGYYKKLLPQAREIARRQGYKGARWPKMVGPEGRESPNYINPFLIWQQPHPLYYAELDYRENSAADTLERWWDVVEATADFMATFAVLNEDTGVCDLGPPLNEVYERATIDQAKNTPFEVAYWRFGLKVAIRWCERMDRKPAALWCDVLTRLAPLEAVEGVYPECAAVFGTLPLPEGIDRAALEKSIEITVQNLRNGMRSWGYALTAMAAARAQRPDLAIQALLFPSESNGVSGAGYNYWCDIVPTYLPGNGSLLSAVAMMAGGWDGAPDRPAPGFPDDGQWVVKSEGLRPML